MRAPTLTPYHRDLAAMTSAAQEVHQAFDAAEGAQLAGESLRMGGHLDDAVEAARRMLRPLCYDVVPSAARRAGGAA